MLANTLLVLTLLYGIAFLIARVALVRPRKASMTGALPQVSVIVAARNEENVIGDCLSSLAALSYPGDKLEVLVMDDGSTDGTARIVQQYASRFSHIHYRAVNSAPNHLRGKTNALEQGIRGARGDYLLLTDADCVVPEKWVEETIKYFGGDRVGLVAGFTEITSGNTIESLQTIDWFFLSSVASALSALGFSVTAIGTNLSVSRTAYDRTGGFSRIPPSVTEDLALVKAVTQDAGLRLQFPLDPECLVRSAPCRSARQLLRQKLRWFSGGRDMGGSSQLILAVIYFYHALLIAGMFIEPEFTWKLVAAKVLIETIFLWPSLRRFSKTNLVAYLPLFEIYLCIYLLLLPPLVFASREVQWKDRSHPQ